MSDVKVRDSKKGERLMKIRLSAIGLLLIPILTLADEPDSSAHTQETRPSSKSQTLKLLPFSIDGGGGVSSGEGYELRGVMGQADVGPDLEGDGYTLTGGVLPSGQPGAGLLFCDGFESGDLTIWSNSARTTIPLRSEPRKH